MDNQPLDADAPTSVWDRLRASIEQLRVTAAQRKGPEAREKMRIDRGKLLRRQAATAGPASAPLLFLAFSRGRRRYGIPVEYVQEVQTLEQFSPVPGTPASIIGVVHWRGAILALLDLSILFDVAESGLSDLHGYIVVEAVGKRLAVAASQVDDILAVSSDHLKTAPEMSSNISAEWVIGVHDENQLILKMDELFKHLQGSGGQ